MARPASKIVQFSSFFVLLCAGAIAHAQDDVRARGIEAYREACLMTDPRPEKIYQWAADRDLKIALSHGLDQRGATKELSWEVARSGTAAVLLQLIITKPEHLVCSVYFDQQRDSDKLVEAFFLEEMKRSHPHARPLNRVSGPDSAAHSFLDGTDLYAYRDGRQNDQDKPHILLSLWANPPPPDAAVPRTFATPERSYRFFVNSCLARFPDIESIGEHVVRDLGWKSPHALQVNPFYHNIWVLWDPFEEMAPYSIELIRSNAFKSCALHFDLRAAMPMERLMRDYGLVPADAPTAGVPPRPGEKFEYYSGRAGGAQAIFKLRTEEASHRGDLDVYVETPQ
jgi:hypothetical protein